MQTRYNVGDVIKVEMPITRIDIRGDNINYICESEGYGWNHMEVNEKDISEDGLHKPHNAMKGFLESLKENGALPM